MTILIVSVGSKGKMDEFQVQMSSIEKKLDFTNFCVL